MADSPEHCKWESALESLDKKPSQHTLDWLTKPYILSRALKRVCQSLSVKVLSQDWNLAYPDELYILGLDTSSENPLVRQVYLQGDNVPFTYGRVVVPKESHKVFLEKFASLGSNLFGETLLYGDPTMKRDPFQWSYLTPLSPLFQETFLNHPDPIHPKEAWARRSVFHIQQVPLLVTEVFLPALPDFKPEETV